MSNQYNNSNNNSNRNVNRQSSDYRNQDINTNRNRTSSASNGEAPRRELSEEEIRRRKIARARKKKAELRKKRRRQAIIRLCVLIVLLILLGVGAFLVTSVKNKVKLEIGSDPVTAEVFARNSIVKVVPESGFDAVDYYSIGRYEVVVKAAGIKHTSVIEIQDTVAPKADAKLVDLPINSDVEADYFVENIVDMTTVKVEYQKKPDFSKEGEQTVKLKLTDLAGNETKLSTIVTLYADKEAPVITGVHDLWSYVGDGISYKEGITVTDNMSENVKLSVDNSAVNLNLAGDYTIIYTATDDAGNVAREEAILTLEDKPEGYVEPDVVIALANEVLAEITSPDMTDAQKAYKIYWWVHSNIGYVQSDYKSSWTGGAYIGLTQRSGDCYIFYSTAKALLTAAGIENIDVVKQDTSHSRHYWLMVDLGTGWYHYDPTNFASGAIFFMVTDAELDDYSHSHNESHNRDMSLYPPTPDTKFDLEYRYE